MTLTSRSQGYDFSFPGQVIPVTYQLALQWLPCQAPGVIALGLVGLVSVYCGLDRKFDLQLLS